MWIAKKNTVRKTNGNTSESVNKSGNVKQREEESLTASRGKELRQKEKLCKVVKKSSMRDCSFKQ